MSTSNLIVFPARPRSWAVLQNLQMSLGGKRGRYTTSCYSDHVEPLKFWGYFKAILQMSRKVIGQENISKIATSQRRVGIGFLTWTLVYFENDAKGWQGFEPLSVQLKGESPLNFQLHFIRGSAIAIQLLIIVGSKKLSRHSSLSGFHPIR